MKFKYKLKKGCKSFLFLHIVEITVIIYVIVNVVKYFASKSPIDPSGIPEFIFIAVLTLMMICKTGDLMSRSVDDIVKLFEEKE